MTERIRVRRPCQEAFKHQEIRRKILKIGLGAGVSILAGGVTGYSLYKIHELFGNDEGSATGLLKGKEMAGEIIDEEELVKRYYEVLSKEGSAEADPTLISSTLYHAMRFFGLEEGKARRRAQNLYLANETEMEESVCQGGLSCIEDTLKGLGVQFSEKAFINNLWDSVFIPSHEAYHLSVDRVLYGYYEEDYGFLGRFSGNGSRLGFASRESEAQEPDLDLISFDFKDPETGRKAALLLAEEFLAESGKQRYFKRLTDRGLKEIPEADEYAFSASYSIFYQGLVDVLDTKGREGHESWQKFWQYQLDPSVTDKLHLYGERKKFYKNLGDVILHKNKNSRKFNLSENDIAGIGVVAFADFAIYKATKHEILQTLISLDGLTQDKLRNIARDLNRKIHLLKFE